MSGHGVVRVLWGDAMAGSRRAKPPDLYLRLLQDVKTSVMRGEQTDMVLCWGVQNFKFCLQG